MSRPHPAPRSATVVLLAVALAASACDGGGDGRGEECIAAESCPGFRDPCRTAACVNGRCMAVPLAAGTAAAGGATGNCRRELCDGAGSVTTTPDDTDVASDGNACTADVCSAGLAAHPPLEAGTACAQDGGSRCDGAGSCRQCNVPADCPGSDTECSTRTCTGGVCDETHAPFGSPLAAQTTGDCREAICDGVGGTTTTPLDSDLPVDSNPCTTDQCLDGVPSSLALTRGLACGATGLVCDGAGACVECLTADDCPGVDAACEHRTCVEGVCGRAFDPTNASARSQTAGNCTQEVCDGAGGIATIPEALDVPVDGDPCTEDRCTGEVPSNPAAAAGTACAQSGGTVCDGAGACVECNVGPDCASGVCATHVCQAPTCSDVVKNGSETDVDCGGTTCGTCAVSEVCLLPRDCASGICTLSRCAAPSCWDGLKNGSETDVDCGGTCGGCAPARACGVDADCATRSCRSGACSPPLVTGTVPADGATDVSPFAAVKVLFGNTVVASSVTVQSATGPCSGTVQLSADGFTTCLGIVLKTVSLLGDAATIQPAAALEQGTTYRVRTTASLFASSLGAFEAWESPAGFTTAGGGACAGALVVSQIYPGGGGSGATYRADFVELHNDGATPVLLDGLSVQYTSATGSTWYVTPLAGRLAAGGYLLVQQLGAGTAGAALPAPDVVGGVQLAEAGGKVAVASSTVALASFCPSVGVLDLVGYGAGGNPVTPATCSEGPSGPAPALLDRTAALVRAGGGCADGNGNAADLAWQLAVPRSSATAPVVCGCHGVAVNGTGLVAEMDACRIESPLGLALTAGQAAGPVYGRVDEVGITEPSGPPPALTGELGWGPAGSDPRWATGWTFVAAEWSAQGLTHDEFEAFFTAPAPGTYRYAYRFTADGRRWTYCDPNGAGSTPKEPFEPNSLPVLTVTAAPP